MFPRFWRCKQPVLLVAALAATGCAGGSGAGEAAARRVSAAGYAFEASPGWRLERAGRKVAAVDGEREVSVTTFRLSRRYRPELWGRVVRELDSVAARLAAELDDCIGARATVVVGGVRARVYRLEDTRDGTRRIGFVLAGWRQYQLLCRGDAEQECDVLFATFTLR